MEQDKIASKNRAKSYLDNALHQIDRGDNTKARTFIIAALGEISKANYHSFACPECGRLGRVICKNEEAGI